MAAQVVGPLAAGLAAADRRGAVLGTLLSGSTGGMLLARTFSGTLGEWLGWRAPYLVAAALALLLAAGLAVTVPVTVPVTAPSIRRRYPALLAEPLRLLRAEPELRRSCLYQAAVFAGFSAVWTCLALLLTGPAYGLGPRAVGMLALVGAATMLCTPVAGRLVDRVAPDPVNLVCMLGILVYMTCAYLGGSAGSWLGIRVWNAAGWRGVCALAGLLAAVALTRHLRGHRRQGCARKRATRAVPGAVRPPGPGAATTVSGVSSPPHRSQVIVGTTGAPQPVCTSRSGGPWSAR